MIEKITENYSEIGFVGADKENSLPDRIRDIIINSNDGFPNKEQVARQLNVSIRTLARNLEGQNTSYRRVVDTLRKDMAVSYLQRSNCCVDDVADILGYSSGANFGRAFKKWTGHTPINFRGEARSSRDLMSA